MKNIFRILFRNHYTKNVGLNLTSKFYSKDSKRKRRYEFFSMLLTRYVNLVKSYEEAFPTAAKLYKTFSAGITRFKDDGILLYQVNKKLHAHGIFSLTRRELEILYEMPTNMIKVAPIVVIGAGVPFGAAIFGLGCMFPKSTLSHHFWSEIQKTEFALIDHKKKLQLYKPIISHLKANLKLIKNPEGQDQMAMILDVLGRGITPTAIDILKCKPVFEEYPYNLNNLGSFHINLLIRLHNLHRGWRRKYRLGKLATLVKAMDLAIVKEGGVEILSQDELIWASFFRGLNPVNMEKEGIMNWLNNWLLISKEIDENSYSLLLHCHVLLAYNEPTNVELLK